jgi:hypothetical protein
MARLGVVQPIGGGTGRKQVTAMIACFDMGAVLGGVCRSAGPQGGGGSAKGAESVGPVRVESELSDQHYLSGAPSVVSPRAPRPQDHPAPRSNDEIRALFARKSEAREAGIRAILDEARNAGRPIERFVAAINYDSERAPRTTNREQLRELGIVVPDQDQLPADAAELRRVLWTIIYGLARLGIYLTGTDALDDRALLQRLCGSVLSDEVADIPPSADMSEFIDLSPGSCDPDGLAGPLDFTPDEDDDDNVAARPGICSSQSDGDANGAKKRDSLLPRPDRR